MKIKRVIGFTLLAGFVGIQFVRPARNSSAAQTGNEIQALYEVPMGVQSLLEIACNDCHSNNTHYPWYSNIQPVAWWLNDHIVEGKEELNFDEFGTYKLRRQYHKMEEVEEMVESGEMPLSSYTLMHGDAKLDEAKKNMLKSWAESVRKQMEAKYPMDSLVRPQKPS
jgi:hypothetical protein